MFVWVTSKKRERHGCKGKSNFLTKKRMSSLWLVSLLQAAAEGSEGSDGSGEDESGDEESSESGDSEGDDGKKEGEEEENEPLSLEWPETRRKQATYLFLLPIVFPLWLTLPDVRNLVSMDRPREHHGNCSNQRLHFPSSSIIVIIQQHYTTYSEPV